MKAANERISQLRWRELALRKLTPGHFNCKSFAEQSFAADWWPKYMWNPTDVEVDVAEAIDI